MSLLEIFYFLAIRPILMIVKKKRMNQEGENNENNRRFNYFSHYLESSTIKSFNYMAEEKSKLAKLFWFGLSVYVFYEATRTTLSFYSQYESEEIATSSDGNLLSIDQIPFPAITIMSDFQSTLNHIAQDYSDRQAAKKNRIQLNESWEETLERKYMNIPTIARLLACHFHGKFGMEHLDFEFNKSTDVVDYLKTIKAGELWFNDRNATWNSVTFPKFQKIVVKAGIAYAFNMINFHNLFNYSIVSDDFFITKDYNEATPFSANANGESEFSITLRKNQYLDKDKQLCYSNSIFIHHPHDIPASQNANFFSYGSTTEILVSVKVSKADESIKSMAIEDRSCFFDGERKLKFFQVYTKDLCNKECLTYFTYDVCGCAPHHYVRSKDMEICGLEGMACTADILQTANVIELDRRYKKKGICNCLPQCNEIIYDIDARTTKHNSRYSEGYI
jgi:hypothetical protein